MPSTQMATASQRTAGAFCVSCTASVPKARRPSITPNSGTKQELSNSRNGSRLCMGSTMASAVHRAAISRPQRRMLQRGCRLWADMAPE
ncbi:hypothetical protein D3C77_718610 [compost metagenome]